LASAFAFFSSRAFFFAARLRASIFKRYFSLAAFLALSIFFFASSFCLASKRALRLAIFAARLLAASSLFFA